MRVEANVSLRPRGTETLGTRVEVKNMNSFRSVERAIAFEIERQTRGARVGRAARPGDARLGRHARRDVHDAAQGGVAGLPLLPRARPAAAAHRCRRGSRRSARACRSCRPPRRARYSTDYGLSAYDAAVIVAALARTSTRRSDATRAGPTQSRSRACCRRSVCASRRRSPDLSRVSDRRGAGRVVGDACDAGEISSQNAEEVYAEHLRSGRAVADIVSRARPDARSATTARWARRSTRSSPPIRPPSPTTAPARPSWSSSWSARS